MRHTCDKFFLIYNAMINTDINIIALSNRFLCRIYIHRALTDLLIITTDVHAYLVNTITALKLTVLLCKVIKWQNLNLHLLNVFKSVKKKKIIVLLQSRIVFNGSILCPPISTKEASILKVNNVLFAKNLFVFKFDSNWNEIGGITNSMLFSQMLRRSLVNLKLMLPSVCKFRGNYLEIKYLKMSKSITLS